MDAAKKREAAAAAADRRAKAARGWVGWLWGGGGGKKAAAGDGQDVDADAEMRGDLTPEDEEALKELATEQEDALRLGAPLSAHHRPLPCSQGMRSRPRPGRWRRAAARRSAASARGVTLHASERPMPWVKAAQDME